MAFFSSVLSSQIGRTPLIIVLLAAVFLGLLGCTTARDEEQIKSMTDEESQEVSNKLREDISMTVIDGLVVSLWASEELLSDPVGINFDYYGRAWVATTSRRRLTVPDAGTVSHWVNDNLSWTSVEDRREFFHHELTPGRNNENTWLSDFNEDGVRDWRDMTVEKDSVYLVEDLTENGYANQARIMDWEPYSEITEITGSVLYYRGDLFVARAPDLLRIRDSNSDGVWDTSESISFGYGVHIGSSGHGMSSLKIGPDGRLYWAIGDIGLNVEGPDGKLWFYPNQGAILRSDPDGSNFEVFAAGLRNPHEFDFDKYGNLISIDNNGPDMDYDRLIYIVNGSDSGWRFYWQRGKYDDPKNNDYHVWIDEKYFSTPFTDQAAHVLPPLAPGYKGPSGFAYNPGTALNDKWNDHFFSASFVGSPTKSGINAFTLKPKGASFELDTSRTVLRGILPTSLDFGPGGSLYTTDWIQGWTPKGTGRIWRIDTPAETGSAIRKETKQLLGEDFVTYEEQRLSTLLRHEDMRVRKKAQFELVERSSEQRLLEAVDQQDHQLARLHGIWGIGQLARGENDSEVAESLVSYLKDGDPEIRAQAAKTLGDVRYRGSADALLPLLEDESPRVQFFATEALGRLGHGPAVQPVVDMLEANNDRDVYLRHAGAIALARIGDVQAVAKLSGHPSEAVRIAAVVALKRMEAPEAARFLSDESEFVVTNAARAINDDALIEDALPDLARMLDQQTFSNAPLLRRAINACLYHGTGEDARRLASFATREGVSDSLRTEALATLSVWPDPSPLDRVTGRYRGEVQNPKADAVRALSAVIDPLLSGENNTVKIALIKAVSTLQMTETTGDLFALMEDHSSPEVTVAVLNALRDLDYEGMDEAIEIALSSESRRLRMTALRLTPSLDISDAQQVTLLASVLNEGSVVEQQSAIKALGSIDSEEAVEVLIGQFEKLSDGSLPEEIQLEVINAADSSDSEKLNAMLEQYEEAKPEDDKVARYREALYGGDAGRGAEIFYNDNTAQCIRCHAVGGGAGPDLTSTNIYLSREEILQSMLDPNARIAPGFGSVSITTEGGQQLQGVLEEKTDNYITVQVAEGETRKVPKEEIAEQTNSPSGMYSMEGILSKRELRDLVEFLATLKNE